MNIPKVAPARATFFMHFFTFKGKKFLFFIKTFLKRTGIVLFRVVNYSHTKGKQMRSRYIQSEILSCLSDYKRHTYREIAEKIEINEKTVARHIRDMSYCYQVTTYAGRYYGGVQLIKNTAAGSLPQTFSHDGKEPVCNVILYYSEIRFLIEIIDLHKELSLKTLSNRLKNLIESERGVSYE